MCLPTRSILFVDDSPEDCAIFERFLLRDPEVSYACASAGSVAEGLERCGEQRFDAILLDYNLPDDDGLAFLAELIRQHGPDVFAVVMITGLGDVSVAARALKSGAHDYLIKDLHLEQQLGLAIAGAIEKASLQRKVEQQRRDLEDSNAQLRAMVSALDEERAHLAVRVDERTADLRSANEALARAMRLKDEFLANMSHELRTPLNGILSIAEALREEIYGPLTERQQRSLKSIEDSGGHLLSLINDILDLSKVEAGKLTLDIEEAQVEIICRQSLKMVAEVAQSKQIRLSMTLDAAVATISVDVRRLKQILVNLLSNAVKFTPQGGSVGLEVRGDSERHTATFTVWDTGIGIAESDLSQLFQPFTQLDSSLSRQYEGTGLGLALVQRLVRAHGGSMHVESAPGKGSRFSATLAWAPDPERRAVAPAPAASPPAQERERSPQILLGEDNELNARAMITYLTAHGYQVTLAHDGGEVLAQAYAARPDLILMDIQMPGIDGLEATRRLRADSDLRDIPVIALTALAMPGDRERCLSAGANDYLTKPVSLKGLIATIGAYLQRERARADDRRAARGRPA